MVEPAGTFQVTLGAAVTLSTVVQVYNPETRTMGPVNDDGLKLYVRAPDGIETIWGVAPNEIVNDGTGLYHAVYVPDKIGVWTWRWAGDFEAQGASEGQFEVSSIYLAAQAPPDLTDLMVLVPRARRYIEGPYGPSFARPALQDSQIYDMVADACADVILFAGSLFGHQLLVKKRDPTEGFPIAWSTEVVLEEWEVSTITAQVALNYYFFVFRDLKTSETIQNEGTEWSYAISVNVIRDYLKDLQDRRDMALKGLQKLHPTMDRYASIIRVRDQATVATLEWWATNIADRVPGLPGGQEAAVVPWLP